MAAARTGKRGSACGALLALLLLPTVAAAVAASASEVRFVLNANASTASTGTVAVEIESESTGSSVVSVTQSMEPVTFDTTISNASWDLTDWSAPLEQLATALADADIDTVVLDVQFYDSADTDITKLMFQWEESWDYNLELSFSSGALSGLTALAQVHIMGFNSTFEEAGWLSEGTSLNQLMFDQSTILSLALDTSVSIQDVQIQNSYLENFPTAVLKLDTPIVRLILRSNTFAGPIELTSAEYTQLANISVTSSDNTFASTSSSSSSSCVKTETIEDLSICIVKEVSYSTTSPPSTASSTSSSSGTSQTTKPESTGNSATSDAMSTAAIVVVCVCVGVLVVGAAIFRRLKKRASKYVEDRLTFTNNEDVLLSATTRSSGANQSALPQARNSSVLAEVDLGQEEVTLHKKLGVQGLWRGEYKSDTVVALKLNPRMLRLSSKDVNALVLTYMPLKHANVVQFLGTSTTLREEVLVVVEHMEKGSLRSVLANKEVELSWPQRIQMAREICSGLAFLRSVPAVEISRNLTSKSVLCNAQFTCKLDIFDYASSLRTDVAPVRSFGQGDIAPRAPELLAGGELTPAAEVYALGVILCEISSRTPVFEHLAEDRGPTMADIYIATEVVAKRLQPTPAEDAPADFRALTLRCLAYEPSERPDVAEVLKLLST